VRCWNRLPREVVESLSLGCSRDVEIRYLGVWITGHGGDGLMVGLDELSGLFQP